MSDGSPDMGAKYRFLPYVRQGYRPTKEFSTDDPTASAQPAFGIDVTPKGRPRNGGGMESGSDRTVELSMYGPGDVQGFDDAQVVRTEPPPDSTDFQPNYFPFVEFDRPDLPWMFSPEKADRDGRIRPWITLITVTDTDGVTVSAGDGRPAPVLKLDGGVDPAAELPDLSESWAWAHVQAHAKPRDAAGDWYGSGTEPTGWLYEELQRTSNITRSRLLSPRRLEPETDYLAAVVPTFEPGRRAGLGKPPYGKDGAAKSKPIQFAWDPKNPPSLPFEIPLYHYWRFTAGEAGTFEKLVDSLEPAELGPGVGKKDVDVRDPGPESLEPVGSEPTTVEVGGAMYSAAAKDEITKYAQSDRLRELLNKPETLTRGGSGDEKFPVVGPPLYGQWHAGLEGIPAPGAADEDEYDPEWFRTLNQNVTHRVAASVGTGVIQEYQEQLVEAAWNVVGEVRAANDIVQGTQTAEVVGEAMESPGPFGRDPDYEYPESRSPGRTRREYERMRKAADLAAASELDWVDPELPGLDGNPLRPGGGKGQGGDAGGDPTGPYGAGANTDPVDFVSVGGARGNSRAGFEDLAVAYSGEAETVTPGDAARTDGAGGTATAGGGDGRDGGSADPDLANAAVYTEYLRTFLSQPETSLQFQRLTRLDGPLATRTGLGAADYRDAVGRASRRAELEVEKLIEAAAAAPPTEVGDGGAGPPGVPAETLVGTDEVGAGLGAGIGGGDAGGPDAVDGTGGSSPGAGTDPVPGGIGDSGAGGETPDATRSGFGSTSLVDAQKIASLGDGSRIDALASPPEGIAGSTTNGAGASDTDDGGVGVDTTARGSLRPASVLPKVRSLETREQSGAALDARIPTSMQASTPAETVGNEGERPETPLELIGGIRESCSVVTERLGAAGDATEDERGSPSSPTLAAYEAARSIRFSLDPLGRAVAKAVADPEVETAEELTEPRAAAVTLSIQESHRELLAALTEAYGSAADGAKPASSGSGDDTGETGGGETGSAGGGETGSPGSRRGTDDRNSGSQGSSDGGGGVAESLSTAEDALGRMRGDLDELQRLLAPRTTAPTAVDLPAGVDADLSRTTRAAVDPRNSGLPSLSMSGIERRIQLGGADRFARVGMVGNLQIPLGEDFVKSEDPIEKVMHAPEFPTPTWRLLKAKSPEFVLPGVDDVPKGSVSLAFENREFVESYMVGLSHELGRELLWRQYPTDRRGTYFKRFWNRGSGPAWEPGSPFELGDPPTKDITPIHEWDEDELGTNAPGDTGTEKLFLLVRGRLFERFPNTVVYASRATVKYDPDTGDPRIAPETPEEFVKRADTTEKNVRFPLFRGRITDDVTFLAFDLTESDVRANFGEVLSEIAEDKYSGVPDDAEEESPFGWYFVFEERPGETRFGLDEGTKADAGPDNTAHDWNDLSWYDTVDDPKKLSSVSYLSVGSKPSGDWSGGAEEWGRNGAHMAGITWQQPVRVSYHAHEMLEDEEYDPFGY